MGEELARSGTFESPAIQTSSRSQRGYQTAFRLPSQGSFRAGDVFRGVHAKGTMAVRTT